MAYYQQTSPFFFKGVMVNGVPVCCKVWRKCDNHVECNEIKTEIDLFKVAKANGIPCPLVIEELTAMNVDYVRESTMQSVKYRLPRGFAVSLAKTLIFTAECVKEYSIVGRSIFEGLNYDVRPISSMYD
jgi:hypothetical protein